MSFIVVSTHMISLTWFRRASHPATAQNTSMSRGLAEMNRRLNRNTANCAKIRHVSLRFLIDLLSSWSQMLATSSTGSREAVWFMLLLAVSDGDSTSGKLLLSWS
ncbi:hypothetical protein BJ166DRAFT_300866 [Pestalotiopsis sp. NC0098]|nr:hypothetical protein BJ166DRAFT_300866 [Pestalotiopsis sp. NC0098]